MRCAYFASELLLEAVCGAGCGLQKGELLRRCTKGSDSPGISWHDCALCKHLDTHQSV
jgi:hypothetical protein